MCYPPRDARVSERKRKGEENKADNKETHREERREARDIHTLGPRVTITPTKLMGDFNKETRAYSYTLMAQAPESHL